MIKIQNNLYKFWKFSNKDLLGLIEDVVSYVWQPENIAKYIHPTGPIDVLEESVRSFNPKLSDELVQFVKATSNAKGKKYILTEKLGG